MQHNWTRSGEADIEGGTYARREPRYASSEPKLGGSPSRTPSGQFEAWSPVLTASEVLAKRWKAVIVWLLGRHSRRFNELHSHMPGVTPKVLTEQLRELERDGLVKRSVIPGGAKHVEYALTAVGETLWPILEQLGEWGRAFIASRAEREPSPASSGAGQGRPSPQPHAARLTDREQVRAAVPRGDYSPAPSRDPFEGFRRDDHLGRNAL